MSELVAIMALGMDADQPTATTRTSKLDTTHLVAALAGLLGLAGYVYVLGGLALYVELFRSGVTAGEAIDEFASRRYLVVGLPIAVIVGGGVLGLVLFVKLVSRKASASLDKLRRALVARSLASVLLAIGAVLMVLCMVAVALVWPPITLRQALVTTQNGECIIGAYISTDGNDVNLADGKADRLRTVPTAEVVAVVIGKKLALRDQSITVTHTPCA